jgi:phenylalanine-4-hydroxylase
VKERRDAGADEIAAAEAELAELVAHPEPPSEAAQLARLYWWTAEYGLVGSLERPRLYGAGLLSSIGESAHCLTPAVRKEWLTAACADVDYDITEMQPRLFVVPDFDGLFDVLESFSAGLSFRVGGDHGLAEAERAATVNHLVLSSGLEVTGRVARLVEGERPAGPGLRTALVQVDGPAHLSRGGVAPGAPYHGTVLVALGSDAPVPTGRFRIELPTGLSLEGLSPDGREALGLRAWRGGREVEVPRRCQLLLARAVPAVAGGPADPGAWDRWVGAPSGFAEGDGEARARARKRAALPAGVADLYERLRALREARAFDGERMAGLRRESERFPSEWLLHAELAELDALAARGCGASTDSAADGPPRAVSTARLIRR